MDIDDCLNLRIEINNNIERPVRSLLGVNFNRRLFEKYEAAVLILQCMTRPMLNVEKLRSAFKLKCKALHNVIAENFTLSELNHIIDDLFIDAIDWLKDAHLVYSENFCWTEQDIYYHCTIYKSTYKYSLTSYGVAAVKVLGLRDELEEVLSYLLVSIPGIGKPVISAYETPEEEKLNIVLLGHAEWMEFEWFKEHVAWLIKHNLFIYNKDGIIFRGKDLQAVHCWREWATELLHESEKTIIWKDFDGHYSA